MATRKKPADAPAAGAADKGIKVVSRPASFCRAGRQFTAEPTIIPLSDLTPDQLKALEEEPKLVTARVDIDPETGEEVKAT